MKSKTVKEKDPNECKISSCHLMKIVGDYCLYHSMLGGKQKQVIVDKFNVQGFKSEIELFEYVWEQRKTCFVTGNSLKKYYGKDIWYSCFAHIISKSKYPKFRLYLNNICMLEPDVHFIFDNPTLERILSYEKENNCTFADLFDLEEILVNTYKKELGGNRVLRKIISLYRQNKDNVK